MDYKQFPDKYFAKADDTRATKTGPVPRFKRTLVSLIEALPQNAAVLDAGCGSGKAIRMVRAMRPDVTIVGTDFADVSSLMPEGVEFKIGSVDELETLFPGRSFDLIICQHVIEHLVLPFDFMRGARALLKEGGKLYIETPNWTRLFTPWAHYFFWNDYTHVRPWTPFAMRKLLIEHDMKIDSLVTMSTCSWIIPRAYKSAVSERKGTDAAPSNDDAFRKQSIIARLFARIINPLVSDVLIAVAKK